MNLVSVIFAVRWRLLKDRLRVGVGGTCNKPERSQGEPRLVVAGLTFILKLWPFCLSAFLPFSLSVQVNFHPNVPRFCCIAVIGIK
jgi:hypothetical protein